MMYTETMLAGRTLFLRGNGILSRLSPRAVTWALLILPGLIWGGSFLFIAEALRATGPDGVTFGRILIGFVTLAAIPGSRQRVPASAWFRIALLGLTWFAFPLSMFPRAEQHVSSALTGMLNGAVPLCTALVASLIARRAPGGVVLWGLVIGLVGVVLMATPAAVGNTDDVPAILMIVAALLSYGVALNIAISLRASYGALPVLWRAQAVALVLTAPAGVPELLRANLGIAPVLALLALGALGTGIAYVLLTQSAGRVGATRASGTTYLIPVVALVLGVVVRGEYVTVVSIGGAAVCIAGAWLMQQSHRSASH